MFKLCLTGIDVVGANITNYVAAVCTCSLPLIAVAIMIYIFFINSPFVSEKL